MKPSHDPKRYWLDQPRNVNRLIALLAVLCALLLLADLLYHKHGEFGFEGWFGFFAWYGFLAYCLIVLSARLLRRWLRRGEDYYD